HPTPTLIPYTPLFRSVSATATDPVTGNSRRHVSHESKSRGNEAIHRSVVFDKSRPPKRPFQVRQEAAARLAFLQRDSILPNILRSEEHTSELQSRFDL